MVQRANYTYVPNQLWLLTDTCEVAQVVNCLGNLLLIELEVVGTRRLDDGSRQWLSILFHDESLDTLSEYLFSLWVIPFVFVKNDLLASDMLRHLLV